MTRGRAKLLWMMGALGALGGCSTARDVKVSGRVTAPSSLTVRGALVLELIDVVGDGKEARRVIVERAALEGLGEFEAHVVMEGDQVQARAVDDLDGDGECSPGEAWGDTHAPVEGDEATDVSLLLWTRACPT